MLGILLHLQGCDGYGKILSIHDPLDKPAPWLLTVIENHSDEDVSLVVAQIAKELGLQPSQDMKNSYYIILENGFSFRITVRRDDRRNIWEVLLIDWPTIQRSEVSKKAEQQLRTALNAPH
ncbi:MAG TPA: hypothetical protein VIF82_12005 [Burkholderiaceae bacterium]|jgi:hypothetical protein